jgi:putative oxidoreductase
MAANADYRNRLGRAWSGHRERRHRGGDRNDRTEMTMTATTPTATTSTAMTSTDPRTAPYAALLLRLTLGGLFLAHAGLKLFVFTPAGTAAFFGSLGLPPALGYAVIAVEAVGGLALILGLYARLVALALVPVLIGAIVTVHGANGFFAQNPGGGWEFAGFWAVMLLVQAGLGDGPYALRRA